METNMGECEGCSSVEPRADHRGRMLCYDCWHGAREAEPCWKVRAVRSPDLPEFVHNGSYLKEEAEKRVAELNADPNRYENVEAIEVGHWSGDRIAHPGYMKRRVLGMRDALSEADFKRWREAMGSKYDWCDKARRE